MTNKWLVTICLLVSLPIFAQQKMSDAEIKSFKAEIVKGTQETNTLTADFVQKKYMKSLAKPVESSGKLYIKMPQKVLIETQQPLASSIVFNGAKMIMKSKGKAKEYALDKNKNFKQLQELIVSAHNGNFLKGDLFYIDYLKEKEMLIAQLTPKSKESQKFMKQIQLYFKKGENTVSQVKMIEASNDYTLFTFKNKKNNTPISDSLFN